MNVAISTPARGVVASLNFLNSFCRKLVAKKGTSRRTKRSGGKRHTDAPNSGGRGVAVASRIAASALLALSATAMLPANEARAQGTIVSICDRTNAVETAILAEINAVEEPDVACDAVTATQLAAVTELDFNRTFIFPVPGDFDGLTGLTSLNLGGNESGEFLSGTFAGLTSLEDLELSGNALIALPPGIFDGLTSLETLDLDDNSLTALRSDTFDGLSNLINLYMRRNALTRLPADLFVGLAALADMTLHDNLFTPATGLPIGVFDDVLDTLGTVTTTYVEGSTNFQIDDTVRAAHFVCSRGDADAIVTAASAGDCLRVTAAQFEAYAGTRFSASIDFDGSFGTGSGAVRTINESTGSALSASTDVGVAAISRAFTTAPGSTVSYTCVFNIGGTATIGTDWFFKDGANDIALTDARLVGTSDASGTRGTFTDTDCGPAAAISGTYSVRIINDTDTEPGGETIIITLASVEAFDAANSGGTSQGSALVIDDADAGSTTLTITIADDENAAATVNISGRTQGVRDAILADAAVTSDATAVLLSELAQITRLDISGVSAVAVGDFANLTNLQTLSLSRNNLTELPDGVFAGLSRLEVLWMSRNSFTTLPRNVFDPLVNLRQMGMSRNPLTSLHVDQFEALTNLRVLWVGRLDSLTTLDATVFAPLVNLRELQLWSNSLTAVASNQFDGLSELRILTLTGRTDTPTANLTSLDATQFDDLDRLQDLRLSGNDFTAFADRSTSLPGLPPGVFDSVLDTLVTITTDDNVANAHFVCSRDDVAAIEAAIEDDCLFISAAQLLAAVTSPSVTLVGSGGNIESGGGTASFTLQVRNYTATLGSGAEYLAIGMSAGAGNNVATDQGIPGAGGLSSGLSTLVTAGEDFTIGLGTSQTVGSGLGGTSNGVFLLDAAGDNPNFIVAVHQSLFAAGASSVSTDTDDAAGEEDIVVTLETGCCAVSDDFVASFNGDAQGYGSGISSVAVPTGAVISDSAVTPTARTITFTGTANTNSALNRATVDDTAVTSFGDTDRTGAITIDHTSAVELEFWASATSSTTLVCDNSETEVTGTLDGDSGIYTIAAASVDVGDNVFNAHVTAQSGTAPADCTATAIAAADDTTSYELTVTVEARAPPTATIVGENATIDSVGGTGSFVVSISGSTNTAPFIALNFRLSGSEVVDPATFGESATGAQTFTTTNLTVSLPNTAGNAGTNEPFFVWRSSEEFRLMVPRGVFANGAGLPTSENNEDITINVASRGGTTGGQPVFNLPSVAAFQSVNASGVPQTNSLAGFTSQNTVDTAITFTISITPPTLNRLEIGVARNSGGGAIDQATRFTPTTFTADDASATVYEVELDEMNITDRGGDTGLTPALLNYTVLTTSATPSNYFVICRGTTIVSGQTGGAVATIVRSGANRSLPGDGGSFDLNVYVITAAFVDTNTPPAPGFVNPRNANPNACSDVDTASAQSHTTKYTVAVSRASSAPDLAELSDLTVTGVPLNPATFSTSTLRYEGASDLAHSVRSVTVVAPTVGGGTVTLSATNSNGTALTVTGNAVDVATGRNTISVLVVSNNGNTRKTYTIVLEVPIGPPTSVVSFTAAPASIAEDGGTSTLTLTLNQSIPATDSALDFPYEITGIQAADITVDGSTPGDLTSGMITVAVGSATGTIEIAGVDDDVSEDETMTFTLGTLPSNVDGTALMSSPDPLTTMIAIEDGDTPGVSLTQSALPISALTITEGGSATYDVVLDTEPTGNVTVTITGASGDVTIMPTTALTFTTSDWATVQPITVRAAEDADGIDEAQVTLTHTPAGGGYGDDETATLTVDVTENDPGSVTVTSSTDRISERKPEVPATITVSLNRPVTSGTVALPFTITIAHDSDFPGSEASDADVADYAVSYTGTPGCTPAPCSKMGGTLNFDAISANTIADQTNTIDISAIMDDIDEGEQDITFTILAAGSPFGTVAVAADISTTITITEMATEAVVVKNEIETVTTIIGATQVGTISGLIRTRITSPVSAPVTRAPSSPDTSSALHLPDNPQDMGDVLDGLGLEHSANADGGGVYAVWARGTYTSMEGDPTVDGMKVDYDGDSTGFGIGAEKVTSKYVAGVAVNWLTTDLDLKSEDNVGLSKYEESLVMIAPYLAIRRGNGRSFWISAGYGFGEADGTTAEDSLTASADVNVSFLNAGADFVITMNEYGELVGSLSALGVRKTVDSFTFEGVEPISETSLSTFRGQGEVTYYRNIGAAGGRVRPYVGLATLHDAGDKLNDDSHALDLRGGGEFRGEKINASLEVSTELLREDHKSWTVSGSARYLFSPDELGMSLTLDGSHASDSNMGLEGGYGMMVREVHKDALLTPFAGLKHGSGGNGEFSSGMRLAIGSSMDADLRAARAFGNDEDTLKLNLRQTF